MDAIDILRRRAGLLVPLSALRSRRDAGAGDLSMVGPLAAWMREAGLSVLQFLPVNDLAPQDSCPYASLSAFALDPVYADLSALPELSRLRVRLQAELDSPALRGLRSGPRADFAMARGFKLRWLEEAFSEAERRGGADGEPSATEGPWLGDYALFRTLKEAEGWRSWTLWRAELAGRDPGTLEWARRSEERRLRFYLWLQRTLLAQWRAARRAAAREGVLLFGDLPFGVHLESADCWARPQDYDFSLSIGAPPDQYSATGQAWGLPAYRWGDMEAGGHAFWRARVRQAAELYDIFRMDHAVGFFRTWVISGDGRSGRFDLQGEGPQAERGRRFFAMVAAEAKTARAVAEDLGQIPPFVRPALTELGIPGYKVLRWEKRAGSFLDPRAFPPLSVATTGNHDTTPLAAWWDELEAGERAAFWGMVSGGADGQAPAISAAREPILGRLYDSGSALVVLPFQDVAGTRERINVPATVGPHNWTYRIPWPVEELNAALKGPARLLRRLAQASGRS